VVATIHTEVIRDPAIMSGEPTVSGTRILAETILSYLKAGFSAEEIFRDYPSLPVDGIDAVSRWAEATYGLDWRFRGMPPFSLEHYELDRVPGETDEEYALRRSMFEDARPTEPEAKLMRIIRFEDIGDADLLQAADEEPVLVAENGRPRFVVMSMHEYDRLCGRSGVGGTLVELTEEHIAAIEAAQVQTDAPYDLSDIPEIDDGTSDPKTDDGFMAPARFMAWAATQEQPHELVLGKAVALEATIRMADRVMAGLIACLHSQLKGSSWRVFTSRTYVQTARATLRRAGLGVEHAVADDGSPAVKQPLLVAEILTPVTDSQRLEERLNEYKALSGLEYILVPTAAIFSLRVWRRTEHGSWVDELYKGPDATVRLDRLKVAFRLADIYDN